MKIYSDHILIETKLTEKINKAPYVNPNANLPGGVIGNANTDVSSNYTQNQWITSRDELLRLVNNLIRMREAKGQLRREEGFQVLIYGVMFTYDVRKGDWRGIVADGMKFIECVCGVMGATASIKDIYRELYLTLIDINNPPLPLHNQHGQRIYET